MKRNSDIVWMDDAAEQAVLNADKFMLLIVCFSLPSPAPARGLLPVQLSFIHSFFFERVDDVYCNAAAYEAQTCGDTDRSHSGYASSMLASLEKLLGLQ